MPIHQLVHNPKEQLQILWKSDKTEFKAYFEYVVAKFRCY